MFRTKVCGITSVDDARLCCQYQIEAIGLNFYDASPRSVSLERAIEIAHAVRSQIQLVGVFVNHSHDEIRSIHQAVGLDLIQLHGDEDPAFLRALKDLRLIKAFRCKDSGLGPVVDYLAACTTLDITLEALLLDAYQADTFGGTGTSLNWNSLKNTSHLFGGYDWILAGGLCAENVAAAIVAAEPSAIDVASGVESAPGIKQASAIEQLARNAAAAFDS